MLAAIRAGITTIIIPEENKKDLEEVPRHILKKVKVVTARVIDDVLKVALETFPHRHRPKVPAKVKGGPPRRMIAPSRKGVPAGAKG